MISRVPDHVIADRTLGDLGAIRRAMEQSREQVSTGRRILRASDDPAGASRALQLRSQIDRSERYMANASSALDEMNVTDGLLQSGSGLLREVRDLVLQSGNAALSPESRGAIADQVRALRSELVVLANTSYGGAPVFSGTAQPAQTFPTTPPYAYQGDAGARERTIGEGQFVTTNLTGSAVFGDGATSVFSVLDDLADDIDAGDTAAALGTGLDALDASVNRVLAALGTIGARTSQVESARTRLQAAAPDLARALSDVADTDLATAITDVQLQQVAYQATLNTLSNIIRPSLLDFLQ